MNSLNKKQPICEYFAKNGHCKFGINCWKSHDVSRINSLNRKENIQLKQNNVSHKPVQNKLSQNDYSKKNVQSIPPWRKNESTGQKPKKDSLLQNKIEEEKIIIKKELCDNFRKGQCSVPNCK